MNDWFTENVRGEQTWMSADDLDSFPEIVHAFTTRWGGVSEGIYSSLNLGFSRGDNPERVEENYHLICSALGLLPQSIIALKQVHGDTVLRVGRGDRSPKLREAMRCEADALITNESGVSLAVFVADCIPLLFYAPDSGAVGAAHAGWRGTVADIAGKTAAALCSEFGGKTENLHVAIGEGIGRCCFETGGDVYEAVQAIGLECGMEQLAEENGGGKYHIDLKEVNRQLLLRAGIPDDNISISSECTCCMSDKYWSHRATKGERGVQAAIIALR